MAEHRLTITDAGRRPKRLRLILDILGNSVKPELKDTKIDWADITAMIESGEIGKLVEIEDEAEHRHVEVWVE